MFGWSSLGSSWVSGPSESQPTTAGTREEGVNTLRDISSSTSGSALGRNNKQKTFVIGDEEQPRTMTRPMGGSSGFLCQPYKVEVLDRELLGNSPGAGRRTAVIETLRQMGIKVFVIDAQNTTTTEEVVQHIRRVVGFVARENSRDGTTAQQQQQRVLFYQDEQGRLFNLVLSRHVTGPAGTWREYLESFSGPEALIALTVLCRSLPCIVSDDLKSLKPAYLSIVLGLVLTEEISLSWLNASMMIRATPSVSAHALTSPLGSDSLRKLVLFTLAFASATSHWGLTMAGVVGAMILLLANLGARSWHALRWRPLQYTGFGSFWIAYLLAVGTGLALPYMGHSTIVAGGKGAVEYVLRTALLVAVIFALSDIDELQRFLVVGSEACDQDFVNMGVGCWWLITVLSSLVWCRRIQYLEQTPGEGERLLEDCQASPVGYKVPSLPDFEIDPTLANTGIKWLPMWLEFVFGSLLAMGVGIWMIALAMTNWDEKLYALVDGFF